MRRFFLSLALTAATVSPALADTAEQRALGEGLFQANCAVCHGKDGKGVKGAGSDIREAMLRQVRMATGGGYENMPEIALSEDQMEAIVAYLNSL